MLDVTKVRPILSVHLKSSFFVSPWTTRSSTYIVFLQVQGYYLSAIDHGDGERIQALCCCGHLASLIILRMCHTARMAAER
jgi:hypothetical protein